MSQSNVQHLATRERHFVSLGTILAAGATEDEALRALATLLRAHASQIETQADRASGEAALLSAGMVG